MKLRRLTARTANRVLAGALATCLLVLIAGYFYNNARVNSENARIDAILQGRINLDQAQINAAGVTIAQAERALNALLQRHSADIAALKAEIAALQAKQATLEAEIVALDAQRQGSSSAATPSTGAPTSPPSSADPFPAPGQPPPLPTPTCSPLLSIVLLCTHAPTHAQLRQSQPKEQHG